jgi:diguanylate cyclase (GGDEF)-like protein
MVGYYSFASLKEDQKTSGRYFIAIANCVFLLLAGVALVQYINNIHSDYIIIVMLDMMVYLMVQVGLIYRRIGLNVREEREFAEAKVFAFTDELTKLGNRHHFFNIVADYEKTKLPADLTYIIVDVNRLKYYNDTMGHEAGDELLKGTAECLKRAFTTSSTATIGRIGGDEFAILIIASELETNRRLFNLRHFLERWHGKYINGISVAIGYCASRENLTLDIDGMAKLADDRMYADKKKFYETTGADRRTSR